MHSTFFFEIGLEYSVMCYVSCIGASLRFASSACCWASILTVSWCAYLQGYKIRNTSPFLIPVFWWFYFIYCDFSALKFQIIDWRISASSRRYHFLIIEKFIFSLIKYFSCSENIENSGLLNILFYKIYFVHLTRSEVVVSRYCLITLLNARGKWTMECTCEEMNH